MKDVDRIRREEFMESRTSTYEAPSIVIIGPLQVITLGALSQNGDPGMVPGFESPK